MQYRQLLTVFVATSILTACSSYDDSSNSTVDLRILQTSDLHMHVVDYDYFQDQLSLTVGLARTRT